MAEREGKHKPKHARPKKDQAPEEEPLPGTAAMGQGQPGAGIEAPDEGMPEQADNVVTGAEALEAQQQDPELDDTSGTRP